MAPPSPAHGRVAVNLGRPLKPPCSAVGEAGTVPPGRDDTYMTGGGTR